MRCALPALFLTAIPILAQTPGLQKQIMQEAGVEMTFRNPRPPVARLTFHQAGTGESQGRKLVRYSIAAVGLGTGGPYILMTWDIGTNAPIIVLQQVKLDTQGHLRCGDTAKDCPDAAPGAELVVGLSGMMGQPRHFVLTGSDKKPIAMGEVVPFPASGANQSCTIEAVLMQPNGSAILIQGNGFQPNEPVKFTSSSYDESVNSDKTANANGEVLSVVLPFVKGHDQGETRVKLAGAKCQPDTTFRWGPYHEEEASPAKKN